MERHKAFIWWKTLWSKDDNSPQTGIQIFKFSLKVPSGFFVTIDKIILKFIQRGKKLE